MNKYKLYTKFFYMHFKYSVFILNFVLLSIFSENFLQAQQTTENDYYRIVNVLSPADIVLEVSGMHIQPNGDLVITTRFGELWLVKNPYMEGKRGAYFKKIASGLHTPMGITVKEGKFYVAQRSEITELSDTDGDEIIDKFQTFVTIDMSGNYCEYVHGPILLPDGSFWVNMNLADNAADIGAEPFFREMGNHVPWKGWAVRYTPEGDMEPIACGLRSPPGMGIGKDGTLYYSENQGGWVGTGFVTTLEEGDFFGHPSGLKSASLPKSNIDLRPSNIPDQDSLMFHEAVKLVPKLKMPSVRLPHGVMGTSLSWILEDTTAGAFGPFEGQLFVADQGQSKIMRIFMEEVKGEMQGAAFQFREGFESGIIRSTWGIDGSMFVGMSDRGWKALGTAPDGLQRLVWTGQVPFEMKAIRATSDGFEIEFTKPVDQATSRSSESYQLSSFDYLFHKEYGSPLVDHQPNTIKEFIVSKDGMRVQLVLAEPLRAGYIYQVNVDGVQSTEGQYVLHPEAYYTLNRIPSEKMTSQSKDKILQKPKNGVSKPTDQNTPSAIQNKHQTNMPSSWKNGPDKTVTINAAAGMTFDKTSFIVKAGSKVKLELKNPTDLLHNLLIVKPGTLETVAQKALTMGLEGPKRDYVPPMDEVLFHTGMIGVEGSEAIYFTAPNQPGNYPYVCTFPGHWQTMQGVMKVVR